MAAIQSAYHRAFLRQRLLREQYPLTLNALYFRFWTPGKGHFLDEVLKNILCGRFALSHAGQPRGVTEKHLSTQPGLKRAAPGSSPDGVPRRRLPGRKRIDRRGFGGQASPGDDAAASRRAGHGVRNPLVIAECSPPISSMRLTRPSRSSSL